MSVERCGGSYSTLLYLDINSLAPTCTRVQLGDQICYLDSGCIRNNVTIIRSSRYFERRSGVSKLVASICVAAANMSSLAMTLGGTA